MTFWRLGAVLLALAMAAACDREDAADPRIARLEDDLRMAQERAAALDMELAMATSRAAEATLLRKELEDAEGRIAELEQAPGLTGSPRAARASEAARERLAAALGAIAAAERSLAAPPEDDGGPTAPRDALRAAADDIRSAAEALELDLPSAAGR